MPFGFLSFVSLFNDLRQSHDDRKESEGELSFQEVCEEHELSKVKQDDSDSWADIGVLAERMHDPDMKSLCLKLYNLIFAIRGILKYNSTKSAPSCMKTTEGIYLPRFAGTLRKYVAAQKHYSKAQHKQLLNDAQGFVDSVERQYREVMEMNANDVSADFSSLAAASGGGCVNLNPDNREGD